MLLSIGSTALLAALLLWRFRSVWILLVVAIPVALGTVAATLVVQICLRLGTRHHDRLRHDNAGCDAGLPGLVGGPSKAW